MKTKVKILLREYPDKFMWESLEAWEKRVNQFVESHEVVELAPIGMDGVMVRYIDNVKQECKHERKETTCGPVFPKCIDCLQYIDPSTNQAVDPEILRKQQETAYAWTRVGRTPPPICCICNNPIVCPDIPVPASGSSSTTYIHGRCGGKS